MTPNTVFTFGPRSWFGTTEKLSKETEYTGTRGNKNINL